MVTKKFTAKKATKASVLRFNPEWFTDPGPDGFKGLTRAAIRDIERAKKDFGKRVNEIIAKGTK